MVSVLLLFFLFFIFAVSRFGLTLRTFARAPTEHGVVVLVFFFLIVMRIMSTVTFISRVFLFHHRAGRLFGFDFVGIVGLAYGHSPTDAAAALLHHVGEFVGDQFAAAGAVRLIRALAEENVLSGGEGAGAEILAERIGFLIGVETNSAKVGAEAGLHLAAHSVVEAVASASLLLNLVLDVGRDFAVFIDLAVNRLSRDILPRQGQNSLDVAVSVLPLQLQKRSRGAGGLRGGCTIESGGVGFGARIVSRPAGDAIDRIAVRRGMRWL